MGADVQGIQPTGLTPEELLKYAYLKNDNGLPKDWCDALIKALADAIDAADDLK